MVILTFIFRNKTEGTDAAFCYFPNCRTLKELRSKPRTYSPEIDRKMVSGQLDSLDIARFLSDGDVDFGRSSPRETPCKYYLIKGEVATQKAELGVRDCLDKIIVETLVFH